MMTKILATISLVTAVVCVFALIDTHNHLGAQQPVVVAHPSNTIDWYWGTCSIPAGSTCPGACVPPVSCVAAVGGGFKKTGGADGATHNQGGAKGTSCPGVTGWCAWHSHFCGTVISSTCIQDSQGLWVPACSTTATAIPGC